MTNEQLIEKILEWEGPPSTLKDGTLAPFWSAYKFRWEPEAIDTTTVCANDHWLKGDAQMVLMPDRVCVYDTARDNNMSYIKLAELPLTENRDDLIAAVRMVMALEVEVERE